VADPQAALRIERVDATRVRVSGALGFTQAAAAYARYGEVTGTAGGAIDLDVGGLRGVDSATLAVLLAWAARAAQAGRTLRLSEVPADLRALARLCDVEPLLGIA
jgi:phospholipid transport system transporter-binding protein